jgi:hypothetical protein
MLMMFMTIYDDDGWYNKSDNEEYTKARQTSTIYFSSFHSALYMMFPDYSGGSGDANDSHNPVPLCCSDKLLSLSRVANRKMSVEENVIIRFRVFVAPPC